MKLLVIGSGGREHAIARKLLSSPKVTNVYCAKGNIGMIKDGIEQVDIAEDDHEGLIEFAKNHQIDWTFVGPEVPLLNGIVDDFEKAGLKIYGPRKNAAMVEGSKEFAKKIMKQNNIPTADYQVFTVYDEAKSYIEEMGTPIVIKADGLAAGKGVVVAETEHEALEALKEMMLDKRFGESGTRVVVEEFLQGQEFSLLAFVRGKEVYPMVVAQDHKAAFDGDKGPNTGGMGAYSPVPQIPEWMVQTAVDKILQPAADGMVENGTPFHGILYAGLIATDEGPKTIEFNARFGDPETQVILPRLTSDLAQIIDDLLNGKKPVVTWNHELSCLGVVVAAEGYPGEYKKGATIPEFGNTVTVSYAGVKEDSGNLVTDGGRVYLVAATGTELKEAQKKVYDALSIVDTNGTFYRIDIGDKAINHSL